MSFSTLWAWRRRFSSKARPTTASVADGKALALVISRMSGSAASAGSSSCAFWISRRRSLTRLSKVRSSMSSKRTSTLEIDSRLLLETNLMLGMVRIASSSGSVTFFSTSAADAPGRAVVTTIQLKLIVGSCWRGSSV